MKQLFLGLDISTQSCKALILNFEERKEIYFKQINYDNDLKQYCTKNGRYENNPLQISESNPQMWIDAIYLIFEDFNKQQTFNIFDITCISVSGQQHGLVSLNKNGLLSRKMSKLWNDFSTFEECNLLTEKIGGKEKMIEHISNTQRTGYTASKIYNMYRKERQIYDDTHLFLLVHNYVNYILTGGQACMEPGDASGTALWDPILKQWDLELINLIDPNLILKLPEVKNSREIIGKISPILVKQFGFNQNCLIASGSGDKLILYYVLIKCYLMYSMMSALSTGNIKEGIISISLGTSGTIYTFLPSSKPFIDPDGEIACFCDSTNNYLPLICISNLANGFESFLKQYQLNYKQFEDIMQKTHPGNSGLTICPWWIGERTPDLPNACPVYFGWQLQDFTIEKLSRGIVEGHVLNLFECFQKLPIQSSQLKEIRLTGGLAQSYSWRQTIANVFNCNVITMDNKGAVFGAALHAIWSFHKNYDINQIIDDFIKIDQEIICYPIQKNIEIYQKLKTLYQAVSKRIRNSNSKLKNDNDPFEIFQQLNNNEKQ